MGVLRDPRSLALLLVTVVLAGCGGSGSGAGDDGTTASLPSASRPTAAERDRQRGRIQPVDGVRQRVLGPGAQAVTVLEPDGQAAGRRPVVVFLHGWSAISPRVYAPWLVHLVRTGNTVIYPRYQVSFVSPPAEALGAAVAGLKAAFAVAPPSPGSLVVAGHSAGGALSADYAASARRLDLPVPAGVFAVYPGRSLEGIPLTIPEVDPDRTPEGVRVVALGSARDLTVGTKVARRIGRLGRYVAVTDDRVDDHRAPTRDDAAARAAFWAPLDRLIVRARR